MNIPTRQHVLHGDIKAYDDGVIHLVVIPDTRGRRYGWWHERTQQYYSDREWTSVRTAVEWMTDRGIEVMYPSFRYVKSESE